MALKDSEAPIDDIEPAAVAALRFKDFTEQIGMSR